MMIINKFFVVLLTFSFIACASVPSKKLTGNKSVDELTYDEIEDTVSEMEQALIYGAGPGDKSNSEKMTLMHLAAKGGGINIVYFLIKRGDKINEVDSLRNTPLHYAVMNGHHNVAALLILKGANTNVQNNNGYTPLHLAAISISGIKTVSPSRWPNSGTITSRFGLRRNPMYGNYHFHYGIDIAAKAGTPIYATADGRIIKAGWRGGLGKAVFIQHKNGYITLYGHCISVFRDKYYKKVKKGELIARVGTTGNSTGDHCHYAVKLDGMYLNPYSYMHQKKMLSKYIIKAITTIDLLHLYGADFNIRDYNRKTALHYAVERNLHITKALVRCGAHINKRDKYGITPLHLAAGINIKTAKFLLQHGAQVNARTFVKSKYYKKGVTPLNVALHHEWLAMARLMVQYGGKE